MLKSMGILILIVKRRTDLRKVREIINKKKSLPMGVCTPAVKTVNFMKIYQYRVIKNF